MDENRVGVFEPDNESLVVQYLKDFAYTLGELEVSFRGVEESRELIMGALQAAGHFYEADRVYVLEMDDELQIGINTYEWCSGDAPDSMIHSHSIPLEQMPRLGQYLKMNKPLVVQDMEDIQRRYPSEYRWLTQQGIFALIAAPYSKRINTGYIIADNPRKYAHDPSLLLLLQYVIVLELNEIKQQKALNMVSKRVSEQPKMDVHINMFGRLEIISSQGVMNEDDLTTEQGCNLLAYMVLNRKMGYSASMLYEALWPDTESDDPYSAIKSVVYRLRNTLACIGLKDLILASHGTFILNPAYTIYTDVDRLEGACKRIEASAKTESKKRLYEGLINLYKGGLLASHETNSWLLPKATYYQNRYIQYLKKYIDLLNSQREYFEIQRIAVEALAIDGHDGDLHYSLINAILDQGNKSVARVHYRQAEQYLSDEQKEALSARF